MLIKIEKLDLRFPGLADLVRGWFDQGLSAQKVSNLLLERFGVTVPRTTVGNFRSSRWAREREERHNKMLGERALQELWRENAMKESVGLGPAAAQQVCSLPPLEPADKVGDGLP